MNDQKADIVLASHEHGDHIGGKVRGKPEVIKKAGQKTVKGIEIRGLDTYHDTSQGRERGRNVVFCFTVDRVRICHLGDLGHELSKSQLAEIGRVDVLLVPVGGLYTIDASVASGICDSLKPRVVIPMHYKTDKLSFPIAGVDDFLKFVTGAREVDSSEIELSAQHLPEKTEVVVLRHAL